VAENQRGAYPHRLWEHEKSKYKRYAIFMQGGSGKVDDLLTWWKVCFHFAYSNFIASLLIAGLAGP
jgi:hypothetical protein